MLQCDWLLSLAFAVVSSAEASLFSASAAAVISTCPVADAGLSGLCLSCWFERGVGTGPRSFTLFITNVTFNIKHHNNYQKCQTTGEGKTTLTTLCDSFVLFAEINGKIVF